MSSPRGISMSIARWTRRSCRASSTSCSSPARSRCRRCAIGSTISRRCSSAGSSTTPPRSDAPSPRSRPARSSGSPTIRGRATWPSSRRSRVGSWCASRARRSRRATSTRSSPWSPRACRSRTSRSRRWSRPSSPGLLARIDGYPVHDLYEKVVARVERPLFDLVLAHTGGNQLKAAEILGLNRNTLRKKLADLGIAQRKRRAGREDRALDGDD
ncbi:MAG: hypothetical protein IPQ07_42635 [Myxococcales bacterium]|nr:hypothetical protein [Myxococcales bacterium]